MKLEGKNDLRINRTQRQIRNAFTEMLAEMPFEDITVTELSRRASINKKTFYRHYSCLDDMLEEVQLEFAKPFADMTSELRYPQDADAITREFLLYSAKQGPLYDTLASREAHDGLFDGIMEEMGSERIADSKPPSGWSDAEWSLYLCHVVESQVNVYKRWVRGGRTVPVNRMVTLGVRLVCNGAYLDKAWHGSTPLPLPIP